ncbi:MAG TPA: glutaredoxin-like protein NrdH [Candidatus Agrococcus pullicola]|uniref:Glutaredoxin-like protein NrdH n=1 Tax=Candidatus Agrococcus pullicola TaxID=2838429 RepID=A0A9D1YW98_9MICO|nr:glutaredoxin-like protein NrdH [Candidatus Agrococcus pullicola]
MGAPITVYTTPNCVQCVATKRALQDAGLDFETVDVTSDPEAMQTVLQLGYQQAPIVTVDATGEHWSGIRPDRIAAQEAVTV